ncbi:hypothetical protein FCM35_KLT17191 [Carex littledalei]|uniref:Dolichol-phosphate mannosyltransferase subunit 3 n=1 Tax=Carex littledalei TaxID=544730 RepID=A0A833VZC7_9POAL|nr:hypothetical protein FCM35_KLT17191 [Carex littledalei]
MERELLEVELHCKSLFAASTIGIVWPGGHIGMKKRHHLLLLIEIDTGCLVSAPLFVLFLLQIGAPSGLPLYLVVALGCYGIFMAGIRLMFFPTCPQEAVLLQQDIVEEKEFLSKNGVVVASD